MKPIPRAKPGKPGTITPDSWNLVVDEIAALHKRIAALTPQKSSDIIHKSSQNGFTSHLTRRGGGKGAGFSHPWKVTANGDDTVAVAAGAVLTYSDGDDLTLYRAKDYAGGNITVTANGFIYGRIAAALGLYQRASLTGTFTDTNGDNVVVDLFLNTVIADVADDIVVAFATDMPVANNYFYFEIAQVTFAEGVATVSKQTLHNNPPLWSFLEPP